MKLQGFVLLEDGINISIEYAKPPKLVRMDGRDAIQLFKFIINIL